MPNYHFVTISGLNFQFGHFIDVLLNISVILQNIKSQKIFRENRKNFFENWSKGGKAKYYNGLNQNKMITLTVQNLPDRSNKFIIRIDSAPERFSTSPIIFL